MVSTDGAEADAHSSRWRPVTPSCDHPAVVAVLKEADSVSQPADRVRTLWTKDNRDGDPEPLHIPRRHSAVGRLRPSRAGSVGP